VSALVESTYRMGLYGIANTVSLQKMYENEYGGKATYFTPRVNAAVFHPVPPPSPNPLRPLQVFCYGRPKHPRNAFELVKQAMRQLKAKMGDRVRIVSAGDEWNPADYGLQGIVENLGLLSYEDTARLYQESQVGVVMMLTRHPSYIPLELMACGCLAVTNINGWTSWLLRDGENCLLAPATASGICDTVERALLDAPLRESVRANALAMVRSDYVDWSTEAEHIFNYLCDPEAAHMELSAIRVAV
jgi:glycosyltransferase involved in cell wall biosynthesis